MMHESKRRGDSKQRNCAKKRVNGPFKVEDTSIRVRREGSRPIKKRKKFGRRKKRRKKNKKREMRDSKGGSWQKTTENGGGQDKAEEKGKSNMFAKGEKEGAVSRPTDPRCSINRQKGNRGGKGGGIKKKNRKTQCA